MWTLGRSWVNGEEQREPEIRDWWAPSSPPALGWGMARPGLGYPGKKGKLQKSSSNSKSICNTGKMQHYKQDYYYYFSQQFDASVWATQNPIALAGGSTTNSAALGAGALNKATPLSSSRAKAFTTRFVPCRHRSCLQVCSFANLFVTPESKLGVSHQATCSQQKRSKVALCLLGPALTLSTNVLSLVHPGLCFHTGFYLLFGIVLCMTVLRGSGITARSITCLLTSIKTHIKARCGCEHL